VAVACPFQDGLEASEVYNELAGCWLQLQGCFSWTAVPQAA